MTVRRGTLTLRHMYFTEDAIYEGHIDYDEVREVNEEWDNMTAAEAAERITREGLTFCSTGTTWAGSPDGSVTTNYATGERCETTAFLDGWPDRVETAIMDVVG